MCALIFDKAQLLLRVVVVVLIWGNKPGSCRSQMSDFSFVPQRPWIGILNCPRSTMTKVKKYSELSNWEYVVPSKKVE